MEERLRRSSAYRLPIERRSAPLDLTLPHLSSPSSISPPTKPTGCDESGAPASHEPDTASPGEPTEGPEGNLAPTLPEKPFREPLTSQRSSVESIRRQAAEAEIGLEAGNELLRCSYLPL